MKNIFSILQDFDIEIKDEQKKEIEKAVNENYKTIAEYNSIKENNEHLTEEINTRNSDIEELEKKLGQEGDSAEKLKEVQDELEAYKVKYKEATDKYESELEQSKYEFAVREQCSGLKFSSQAGKNQFIKELIDSKLELKEGKLLGFDDFVKDYKEKDAGLFATENKAGNFGGKTGGKHQKMTKEDILKIENRAERQRAIAEHLELFNKSEE